MMQMPRTFRTPPELWDAVKETARDEGISESEVVRRGLVAYEPLRERLPDHIAASLREHVAELATR